MDNELPKDCAGKHKPDRAGMLAPIRGILLQEWLSAHKIGLDLKLTRGSNLTTPIRVRNSNSTELIARGMKFAKNNVEQRQFFSAIETIQWCISRSESLHDTRRDKYKNILSNAYELLGDIYVTTQEKNAALGCFITAYKLSNINALRKALYLTKVHFSELSAESFLSGFLLMLLSDQDYPGKNYNTANFLKMAEACSLSMSDELKLLTELYIMRGSVLGLSAAENLLRQDDLFTAATTKYGERAVADGLEALSSHTLTLEANLIIETQISAICEQTRSPDNLTSINYEICKKFPHKDGDVRAQTLNCDQDYFWGTASAQALYQFLKEDINFAFSYDAVIDSFVGHPAVKREIKIRAGLYSPEYLPLNEERFDNIFLNPLNIDSARALYRRVPIIHLRP